MAGAITSWIAVLTGIVASVTLLGCGGGGGGSDTTTITATTTTITTTTLPACLCIFDIDRTLTAKQGTAKECPGTEEMDGIEDKAYDGGVLILSNLALNLEKSFCAKCKMGIVTAGIASGPGSQERAKLLDLLTVERTMSNHWSDHASVNSSMVINAPDTHKQDYVRQVVDWFKNTRDVFIADSDVHFFDDRPINVAPFKDTGFNAREISCTSRDEDPALGKCGGLLSEVVEDAGVKTCTTVAAELAV